MANWMWLVRPESYGGDAVKTVVSPYIEVFKLGLSLVGSLLT